MYVELCLVGYICLTVSGGLRLVDCVRWAVLVDSVLCAVSGGICLMDFVWWAVSGGQCLVGSVWWTLAGDCVW